MGRSPNNKSGVSNHPSLFTNEQLPQSQTKLPEKNFNGINRGRYQNAEYDALMDRYLLTIPLAERMQVLGDILHHETDQLVYLRLIFDPEPTMVSNRLKNVPAATPSNIQTWEVTA